MGLKDLGLTLALPTQDELPFITDSWAKSFRDSPYAGCITNDRYHETCRWTITSLLARGAVLTVAVPLQGDRRVVGWACHERPDVLHALYVKARFRGLGVARALVDNAQSDMGTDIPGRISHRHRGSTALLRAGWRFAPETARVKDLK